MRFELETSEHQAKIKVVGVGGGGGNAVANMIAEEMGGVEFIVANTDMQTLAAHPAPTKLQLGANLTKGLGAGGMPEIGQKAALEDHSQLKEVLAGADMVFVACGMGGGTGTGAAPIVAQVARDCGALTVGVVTKPFKFEGRRRSRFADDGIATLAAEVDTLICIPNEKLLSIADAHMPISEAFRCADKVLSNAVRGISDLITIRGDINVDFADVRTVMTNRGRALMGTGYATGERRAVEAAEMAVRSPLLEDVSIDGAMGILINITGGPDLTLQEVSEAVSLVEEAASEDALVIFGYVILDEPCDEVKVTVIATGFNQEEVVPATPARAAAQAPQTRGSFYGQTSLGGTMSRPAERPLVRTSSPSIPPMPALRHSDPPEQVQISSGRTSSHGRGLAMENDLDIPAFMRKHVSE